LLTKGPISHFLALPEFSISIIFSIWNVISSEARDQRSKMM